MNTEEAIKRILDHMKVHHIGEYPHLKLAEALNMAIAALREHEERENPNPLTLDELAAIDTPVWIQRMNGRDLCDDGWAIVYGPICLTKVNGVPTSWSITVWWFGNEVEDYPEYKNYGKTWLAYRSKPKEGTE